MERFSIDIGFTENVIRSKRIATVFLLLIHPSFGFLIVFIVRVISRKVADAFGNQIALLP